MAKDKTTKKETKGSRVHLERDKSGGRVSVDLNKSGSVRAFASGGGQPKTHFNPRGETHVGAGLQFRFGGGAKKRGK